MESNKQPVRCIHLIDGKITYNAINELVVYTKRNGEMFSNYYGKSSVINENGELVIRRNSVTKGISR